MRYLGQFPCAARAFLIPCPTGFLTGDPNGIITLRTWRTGAPVWQVRATHAQRTASGHVKDSGLHLACSDNGRYLAVLEVARTQTAVSLYRDGVFAWRAALPPYPLEYRNGFYGGGLRVRDDGQVTVRRKPFDVMPGYQFAGATMTRLPPIPVAPSPSAGRGWRDNTGSAPGGYAVSLSLTNPTLGRVQSSTTGDTWTFTVPGEVSGEDAGVSCTGRFAVVYATTYHRLPPTIVKLLRLFPALREQYDTRQNCLLLYARTGRCLARLPLDYAWVWPKYDAHCWQAFPAPDGKTVVAWTSPETTDGTPTVLLLRGK